MRSRWLAGLEMPEIPVEDDPRVQKRFEFYTENPLGRETFQQMLFRCGAYKDMIQSSLIRRGLPKDLIAVAYAESGCYPLAKSPMGAEGLVAVHSGRGARLPLAHHRGRRRRTAQPAKGDRSRDSVLQRHVRQVRRVGLGLCFVQHGPVRPGRAHRAEVEGEKVGFWELVDAEMLPGETADYAPAFRPSR